MDIQKEKIKQEFWNWAKVENPRVVENAELGDVYATQILDHMFMGFAAAKAQAVPEKDAVIKKLSDQLYEQEMKTSAARVLCETACELLDDYAHQDAMVILNDLEQAMSTGANQ